LGASSPTSCGRFACAEVAQAALELRDRTLRFAADARADPGGWGAGQRLLRT
jgi:hypothetical protein